MKPDSILPYKLLVVDDDPAALKLVRKYSANLSFLEAHGCSSPLEALSWAKENHFDIALTDFKMPKMNGVELANALKEKNPESYFLIMTGHAEIQTAIAAIRAGIFDFILKPFDLSEFIIAMERVKKNLDLKHQNQMLTKFLQTGSGSGDLVGQSHAMNTVREKIKLFSNSNAPVLITGETGVGKEIVARMIHCASQRKKSPFIAVNCSAYVETLLESELFGHEKGAFTGADKRRIGRLEFAQSGTILLDEICEIPPQMQVKLLRILQEKEFERVGGNTSIELKARLISATNRNISEEIQNQRFREDLFYRINTLSIHVPPLREREGDINILSEYFLKKFNMVYSKEIESFDKSAVDLLTGYQWPGNVRQLENVIDYAVLSCDKKRIKSEHFPSEIADQRASQRRSSTASAPIDLSHGKMTSVLSSMESEKIKDSLDRNRWNKSKTASELGLTARQLSYRLKKYNIE